MIKLYGSKGVYIIMILGIDFGGVIVARSDKKSRGSWGNKYLDFQEVVGAIDAISLLNRRLSGHIWLVSKVSPAEESKSREWLRFHHFWQRTGLNEDRLIFCQFVAEKAQICQWLEITDFVDDRLAVLGHLKITGQRLWFNPNSTEPQRYPEFVKLVLPVENWDDVITYLSKS